MIISDEEIECFKFTGTEFFNTHAGPYKYFIHLLRKYAYINKKQIITITLLKTDAKTTLVITSYI